MTRTVLPIWDTLKSLGEQALATPINALFEQDEQRQDRFSAELESFYLDFSKQRLSNEGFDTLLQLAEDVQLREQIQKLFSGERLNNTENRPALHTALRLPAGNPLLVEGEDLNRAVQETLQRVKLIVEKIHSKQWRGFSGKAITDVVNIGVGGSDLGPQMACSALDEFTVEPAKSIRIHFVSSMDGTQIFDVLNTLNPETTLFIISSKSFTTVDTFYNANTAIAWMQEATRDLALVMQNHFIAVSAHPDRMSDWGVPESNQLPFWEWVGGRFSLWSSIGLSIAVKIGFDQFRALLDGAHAMDQHFLNTPFERNIPALMGLLGAWNATFLGCNAHTVLPYDGRLGLLPNYLTQLEMESNGKSVTKSGKTVPYDTCPILWGDIGPNAQHAFYQLLHQGTQSVACDFIAPINRYHGSKKCEETSSQLRNQHTLALANLLAQSRVLAFGNKAVSATDEKDLHRIYNGNQASSVLLFNELNPFTLGGLIAIYEHKVFTMSVVWNINPFDQWGVELGKKMAKTLEAALLNTDSEHPFDASTNQLLTKIKSERSS
ncbi:MAG: glucose-6-phosphate isomerase [Pseudomonadota bacterium]|nr:glucose-6-phosphate isomerase [Pseudomonadota bacterium]